MTSQVAEQVQNSALNRKDNLSRYALNQCAQWTRGHPGLFATRAEQRARVQRFSAQLDGLISCLMNLTKKQLELILCMSFSNQLLKMYILQKCGSTIDWGRKKNIDP